MCNFWQELNKADKSSFCFKRSAYNVIYELNTAKTVLVFLTASFSSVLKVYTPSEKRFISCNSRYLFKINSFAPYLQFLTHNSWNNSPFSHNYKHSKLHTNLCKVKDFSQKHVLFCQNLIFGLRWLTNLSNTQTLVRSVQNTVTKTSFWETGDILLVNDCYSLQHKYSGTDTVTFKKRWLSLHYCKVILQLCRLVNTSI